jgi:hypothetical protein
MRNARQTNIPPRGNPDNLSALDGWFQEEAMGEIIQRVLEMFGKKKEPASTEEALLDFLSKKPDTEERARAVEEVDFLKDLRT